MNRPLAMALCLSTALLLSACSDSQPTDGKSDSTQGDRRAGKGTSPTAKKKIPSPRAATEKEAVAVLEKAKAELTFDEDGYAVTASFKKVKLISDEALVQLATLKKLERLRLDGHDRGFNGEKKAQLVDEDLAYIQGLTRLRFLHLGDNWIEDKGLERLKSLTNLEYLFLNDTAITDGGLAHLRGLSKLRRLDLQNTSITNAGLDYLKDLPALKRIGLNGSLVDDEGVRALKAAVSEDVQIVYQFTDEPDGDGLDRDGP